MTNRCRINEQLLDYEIQIELTAQNALHSVQFIF